MTWIRRRLEGVVVATTEALHALDNPDVLFYVMFAMTIAAWVLVFLLIAGVV